MTTKNKIAFAAVVFLLIYGYKTYSQGKKAIVANEGSPLKDIMDDLK